MADEQKPIFLSHSYHDKELADRLVNLLTNGCDVSRNDILCTSLNGMNIKVGTSSFIDYLQDQLKNPKLVILLITENYLASSFCLAELGATWRMGIQYFPLAVPPIARSGIGGVLEVTQAGDISNGAYLSQLRDKIIELFGKKVPTDGWDDQKDIFLNGLDAVISGLKKPDLVQRAELEKAHAQYNRSLDTINAKDIEIGRLKAQMAELAKHKDAQAVRTVEAKFSTTGERFEKLRKEASAALSKLKPATTLALFWEIRGDVYCPKGEEAWDEVRDAEAVQEVRAVDEVCRPNADLLLVQRAQRAVEDLKSFLRDSRDRGFFARFEEEHEYPADVGHQKFWSKRLRHF
jgi:hypothetical protein